DLRLLALLWRSIDGRPVHGVAARRVPAIRPIQHPVGEVGIQIDRLRQPVEEDLYVLAVGRRPGWSEPPVGPGEQAPAGGVLPFWGPVDLSSLEVEGWAAGPVTGR